MTQYTVWYVDDEKRPAERLIRRLNRVGNEEHDSLHVEYLSPPKSFPIQVDLPEPEMFFVDYQLDNVQEAGDKVGYTGRTVAAWLRDAYTDHPIVLVTRQRALTDDPDRLRRLTESLLFDDYIPKSDINEQPDEVTRRCVALIEGFKRLRDEPNKSWRSLTELMGALSDEERSRLREALPPVGNKKTPSEWEVTEAAQWLLDVVLTYPGILYDELHAATYLGLSVESFRHPEVQRRVERAHYTGVLGSLQDRWWRNRLTEVAQGELSKAKFRQGSSINRNFLEAVAKNGGPQLEPSVCAESNTTPADRVCFILRQPVKSEYSLVYRPDGRPAVMEDARVSFKAIRESNNYVEQYFDPTDRKLLRRLQRGEANDA